LGALFILHSNTRADIRPCQNQKAARCVFGHYGANGTRWQKMARFSDGRRGGRKGRQLERSIEALLSAASVQRAAEIAGLSTRTAWRWMADPIVRERLTEARQQYLRHTMVRLTAAASGAVSTLLRDSGTGRK
jgi:hypothetical protein